MTVSEPLDQEDTPKSLRMIFSTRKGMGITLTNYVWTMVEAGNFEILPDHLFNILMFHEMIIPADEDELEEIIARKVCMAGDTRNQEAEVCIDLTLTTDPAFADTFKGLLQGLIDTSDQAFRKTLKVTVPDAGRGNALRVAQFVEDLVDAHSPGDTIDVQYCLVFDDILDIQEAQLYDTILPQVARIVFAFDQREDMNETIHALTQAQALVGQSGWQTILTDVRIPWTDDASVLRDLAAPLKALATYSNVRIYPAVDDYGAGGEDTLLQYLRRLELHLNLLPGTSCTYSKQSDAGIVSHIQKYTVENLLSGPSNTMDRRLYDNTIVEQLRAHTIACSTCTYLPMCGGQVDKGPGDDSCPAFVHNFGEKVRLKYALAPGRL
ncbi:hypothetical protein [Parachryseolinea silvisoli]|uniref:hypothetical protein n=1 Tax=Parachryseolinea silvisoli TaxID=2873601 RepID=UPI00226598F4|nr:hypothetical protein [Parachryseolinea silvisoli]MCD9019433.1 hypothetical protein [Parachryseolinea silvisoli]